MVPRGGTAPLCQTVKPSGGIAPTASQHLAGYHMGPLSPLVLLLHPTHWAELKGGIKTYRKAKPREEGPFETVFGDSPTAVLRGGRLRELMGNSRMRL